MSLPILHSFAGYSVYKASQRRPEERCWKLALLCMVLANFADLDFLPGILLGNAGRFHRGVTHSVGAALLCGVLVGAAVKFWKKLPALKAFVIMASVYATHLVLDYLSGAEGMPVLWPWSSAPFFSRAFIPCPAAAASFHTACGLGDFLSRFLSPAGLSAISFELFIVFTLWALVTFQGELRRKVKLTNSLALTRAGLAAFFFLGFVATKGMG